MEWKNGYKKDYETFLKELKEKNIQIKVIGDFKNYTTNIKCKCLICNNGFENIPSRILTNQFHGCHVCSERARRKSRCLTNEEFLDKVPAKTKDKIEIYDVYQKRSVKLKCKCKICNHEWYAPPNGLIQGSGCPNCANNILKTDEQYKSEVYKKFNNVEVLNTYKGSRLPMKFRCLDCKHEWKLKNAYGILKTEGCPACASIRRGIRSRQTHEEFINKFYSICHTVEIIDKYIKSDISVLCKCKICNGKFYRSPADLLLNYECPICGMSKGERRIVNFLDTNSIEYMFQKTYDDLLGINGYLLRYDFYLKDYNLLIEYQGQFHDGSTGEYSQVNLSYQQEHDRRKRKYAEKNNIKLLEIWYYDFDNIEEILKKELKLNKTA